MPLCTISLGRKSFGVHCSYAISCFIVVISCRVVSVEARTGLSGLLLYQGKEHSRFRRPLATHVARSEAYLRRLCRSRVARSSHLITCIARKSSRSPTQCESPWQMMNGIANWWRILTISTDIWKFCYWLYFVIFLIRRSI